MNTTSRKIDNAPSKYSYGTIAAKLFSHLKASREVTLINSFSHRDPGRDRANLVFIKQFGVVPMEINSPHGRIEDMEIDGLEPCKGTLILIESIFLSNTTSSGIASKNSQEAGNIKIEGNTTYIRSREEMNENKSIDAQKRTINHHAQDMARKIEKKYKESTEGYIYISGFSVASHNPGNAELPQTEYIPMYLELSNIPGETRRYEQHELESYLNKIGEKKPMIDNLEELLVEMESRSKIY